MEQQQHELIPDEAKDSSFPALPAHLASNLRDPAAWDPFLSMRNRHPTKECIKRVRKDIKDLLKDPLPGTLAFICQVY
jgi:hypothetical protein